MTREGYTLIYLYIVIGLILLYLLMVAYLIAPGKDKSGQLVKLLGVNYAHRGLHNKDNSVPENSMAAFRAALDRGYGIELDVRLSLDGEIFVFHDVELDRCTECDDWADGLTYSKLLEYNLFGTNEKIPLLTDVLDLVDGKVPLLIEVKRSTRNTYLCRKLAVILNRYDGPFCIMSFDPTILSWFRKNMPDVCRGIIVAPAKNLDNAENQLTSFAGSRVLGNYLGRPHILAHRKGKKTLNVKLCEAMGAVRFTWTITDDDDASFFEKNNSGVIFEHYTPEISFFESK